MFLKDWITGQARDDRVDSLGVVVFRLDTRPNPVLLIRVNLCNLWMIILKDWIPGQSISPQRIVADPARTPLGRDDTALVSGGVCCWANVVALSHGSRRYAQIQKNIDLADSHERGQKKPSAGGGRRRYGQGVR